MAHQKSAPVVRGDQSTRSFFDIRLIGDCVLQLPLEMSERDQARNAYRPPSHQTKSALDQRLAAARQDAMNEERMHF